MRKTHTTPAAAPSSPPMLTAAIDNATRAVLEQHDGIEAFIGTREAAVAHEVGHAIVGTHEGLKIRRISIYSYGNNWGGVAARTGPGGAPARQIPASRTNCTAPVSSSPALPVKLFAGWTGQAHRSMSLPCRRQ
jgi:hypothetical protein